MPNDKFFASTQFNGGHENNVLAVRDGKVDVAVDDSSGIGDFKDGYTSGTFHKEVAKGAVDPERLRRSLALGPDPERPAGRAHRARRRLHQEDHRLHDRPARARQGLLRGVEGGDFTATSRSRRTSTTSSSTPASRPSAANRSSKGGASQAPPFLYLECALP